ncbi:unnamed protein product [Sympodiomycopsis kandeliae]
MKLSLTTLLPVTLAAVGAMAHPDLHGDELAAYRRSYVHAQETLGKRCSAAMRRRRAMSNFKRSIRGHPPAVQRAMYNTFEARDTTSDNTTNSACILAPEVTQGPYHILGELVRTNVTEDQGGVPLTITMSFTDIDSCEPLNNYWVDFWHANATGIYSGYIEASTGAGGGSSGGNDTSSSNSTMEAPGTMTAGMTSSIVASGTGSAPMSSGTASASSSGNSTGGVGGDGGGSMSSGATDQNTFLRGVAQTDSEGQVTFDTVFPGWYVSRAVHIHIRAYGGDDGYKADNGTFVATGLAHHTGQLFFDDAIGEELSTISPYSENTLTWDQATKNADDQIYVQSEDGGWTAIVDIAYVDDNDITKGMTGTINVAVNTTYQAEELSDSYYTGTTTTASVSTSLSTALSTGNVDATCTD